MRISLGPLMILLLLPNPHRRHPPLLLLPPLLHLQIPRLQPLQLLRNLLALVRDAMRLLGLGPEVRDREFAVQVCAEVVHDADGEENVHAKLSRGLVEVARGKLRVEGSAYFGDFEIGTAHLVGSDVEEEVWV